MKKLLAAAVYALAALASAPGQAAEPAKNPDLYLIATNDTDGTLIYYLLGSGKTEYINKKPYYTAWINAYDKKNDDYKTARFAVRRDSCNEGAGTLYVLDDDGSLTNVGATIRTGDAVGSAVMEALCSAHEPKQTKPANKTQM